MRIFLDVTVLTWMIPRGAASLVAQRAAAAIPPPLVIPPSQNWDGVDGQWSSFGLRVGQPAQDGCTTQAMNPLPSECSQSRGGLFTQKSSTSWSDIGFFGINQAGVGFEANLGYTQAAEYGLDTLGLGYPIDGPILQNQTIAGFATASPFYMGMLGLGTQPVNYSALGNFSAPSLFTSLRSQAMIPSLSWSFTAGANYRLKAGQPAQLIFGGYDTSRFASNTASFSMANDIDRDLVVAIQAITYRVATERPLLDTPIYAFIESTDPNIWLPEAACRLFEEAFGISIDNKTGLYLINSTQFDILAKNDPHVTFTLANGLSGGDTVDIDFPFSAFALQTAYPFTAEAARYFPLRQSANASQNTLGRVFLQEAYLTVDYENSNFSVSQCTWDDGAKSQIVSIVSSEYVTTSSNTTSTPPTSKNALTKKHTSGGVIAAAVLASIVWLLGITALVIFLLCRQKRGPRIRVSTENDILNVAAPASHSNMTDSDAPEGSQLHSPLPVYKKYQNHSFYGMYGHLSEDTPRIELPVPDGETYQLSDNSEYNSEARALRAANTPEAPGSTPLYELAGSEHIELDDMESRSGLSPSLRMGPRTPTANGNLHLTNGSPLIPSPPSPLSPFSDFLNLSYESKELS